jgi:hypothetical protein
LQLPLTTVEKELRLSRKKIEQSLSDEVRLKQWHSINDQMHLKQQRCLDGLNSIIRESRINILKTLDIAEKRKALALVSRCSSLKLGLFDKNKSAKAKETAINYAQRFILDYKDNDGEM